MAYDNNAKPVVKKTALNNSKLSLSAPCPTAKGKFSVLRFDLYMNNPRIVIKTNDPQDMNPGRKFGMIQAGMDAATFFAFLASLEHAYKASGEWSAKVENFGGKDPVHMTDLWIGKDKEGVVFISVISKVEERAVIKFAFGPTDQRYHHWMHKDGTTYSKAETSVLYAKAYHSLLSSVMSGLLITEYKEPPPYNPSQNGGGYKGNNNNSGSGAANPVEASDFEDLLF